MCVDRLLQILVTRRHRGSSLPGFLTPPESARYRWRVGDRNQLSPGAAIVIGVFFGAMGTFVLLQALGTFGPARLSDGTPPWVGVVAGLLFLLGGLAPWIALANMSTMMYLLSASVALRPAGPA